MDASPEPGPMESSVAAALAAMRWVEPSDGAAVDLALLYARQIDTLVGSDDLQLRTKGVYLGPHLLKALAELGGTPTVRIQHELRSLKLADKGAAAGGGGTSGDEAEPGTGPSSVTSIERPAKRHRSA